jgi:Tol biopolymer transport system component
MLLGGAVEAGAACNLIPSARQTFRASLGSTNRPYAAPGDYVEIGVRPGGCDAASPGFGGIASDHIVTVVFTPPANGTRRVAFLTADDCSSPASVAKLAACEATVGAGRVACVGGSAANLALVDREGIPHLSFRFPSTDALAAPDGDQRTLSGPATLAVTAASAALPCGLAMQACASQGGTIACIDDLYAADGSCQPNLEPTFPHFTALPVPNDYRADCWDDTPPCTALATEVRSTVDTFGNLLMPINWEGVLVNDGGTPVPRLLHAAIRSPLPVPTPPAVNLGSFTPEGAVLPPIFEPNVEPGSTDPNVLRMFGSADAGYTILRLARRTGTCVCGSAVGASCVLNSDCADPTGSCGPGQVRCPTTCVGGTAAGGFCTTDADCPGAGARCGLLFTDFRPLAKSGAPIVLARTPLPNVDGVCQVQPNLTCEENDDCTGPGDPCVSYAFEASTPVPLESLTTISEGAYGFSVTEAVALEDLNGDGDTVDAVVTLRDRRSGETQPLGGQAECDLSPNPTGRAIIRSRQSPFVFPAVEAEDDLIAFLESEADTTPTQTPAALEVGCDENGDGDDQDSILRVFRLGPTELAPTPVAVDAGLDVNGRSLALSNGVLFFRRGEASSIPETTARVGTGAAIGSNVQPWMTLSHSGRYLSFVSVDELVPEDSGNSTQDVYVRDLATNTLELVSARPDGLAGNGISSSPSMSADGRWVVFTTLATDIIPGAPAPQIVLRDRCVSDGEAVSGCTVSSEAVGLTHNGMQPTGGGAPFEAVVSDDGRFVAFVSDHSDLVSSDTNACPDFDYPTPGTCPDVFLRDRCMSNGMIVDGCSATTELVSIASDGTQADGPSMSFANVTSRPAISSDGRFIAFASAATNLASPVMTADGGVYVRDRRAGVTELVSVRPDGTPIPGFFFFSPSMSRDGRYVAFLTVPDFVPTIGNGLQIVGRDRLRGSTEVPSLPTNGALADGEAQGSATISHDGRYVGFSSSSTNLVPEDTNVCGSFTTAGSCPDAFVLDRQTGAFRRLNVAPDGTETSGAPCAFGGCGLMVAVSGDGLTFAFSTNANGVVAGDSDDVLDAFVRRPDPALANAADLTGDGDADDTVLQVLDTAEVSPSVSTLCPSGEVATAAGRAVFLRRERDGGATGCPAGVPIGTGIGLNADTDAVDEVVHLWRGGLSSVENLHCAADGVAMSDTTVGALVSETAEGTDLNGDDDIADTVARAYPLSDPAPGGCGAWLTSALAAEALQACGTHLAFLVPECGHGGSETDGCPGGGTDLNGDGDASDRVLHVWNPNEAPTNTQRAAEELVCSDTLVAFRTREAAQCPGGAGCSNGLNGPTDTDLDDDVLSIWELETGALASPGRAVRACNFAACDPRFPYRVLLTKTRFLTTECDQAGAVTTGCPAGGLDINGDGDADDIVLQNYDFDTAEITVLGEFDPDTPDDPTDPASTTDEVVFETTGRCIETVGGSCTDADDCGTGEFCGTGVCRRAQGVCETSTDCPPSLPCDTSAGAPIVPASPDTDDDDVPDHLDNCPAATNIEQEDLDADGVGDACDLATCGNDTLDYDEQCDGSAAGQCSGGCLPSCRCAACGVAIADPRAAVVVRTRDEAGQLRLRAQLPLTSYTGEPVSLRLDDGDSTPIALQSVGALPPKGTSGRRWQFKTTVLGVQKVLLRRTGAGAYILTAKAKGWFPTAVADQPAANTQVTATLGTQCFTRAATVKID